jgi:murein DD-endopeptidase MepM/ murein hydrolase activator NlpD
MTTPPTQPPVRLPPRYGFGKRMKTASISAMVTSVFWIVFMVLYWPQNANRAAGAVVPDGAGHAHEIAAGRATAPQPDREYGAANDEAVDYVPPAGGLRLPVQGVSANQLTDTYAQARGDGTRGHNAIDIMASRGTPVLAAAAGTVEKLFLSKNGGTTLYERSPDGKAVYYYAHLDSYAPGVTEGMSVAAGQVIGFVGSSGDADPGAPHLHFAIMALSPGERWWKGRPINPYPLLGGR